MFKNTKEAFLNCNIDTLTREFSLLHQKQDKNDGKSDCFHSIETEVLTAIKRIKKTQPIESNRQDLLIVCKSFEDTGDDVFCVEAKDFALWEKHHLKNQPISEYISDETLTFMDRNDILSLLGIKQMVNPIPCQMITLAFYTQMERPILMNRSIFLTI